MPEIPNEESLSPMELVEKYREDILSAPDAKIVPPIDISIPEKYDLSQVKPDDRPLIDAAIEEAKDFIQKPIITDGFETHEQRRQWRTQKVQEITESRGDVAGTEFNMALGQNKLKRNICGRLYSYAFLVQDYVPEEITDPIIELTQNNIMEHGDVDVWEDMPNEQKIKVVNELAGHAEALLRHFEKKEG